MQTKKLSYMTFDNVNKDDLAHLCDLLKCTEEELWESKQFIDKMAMDAVDDKGEVITSKPEVCMKIADTPFQVQVKLFMCYNFAVTMENYLTYRGQQDIAGKIVEALKRFTDQKGL